MKEATGELNMTVVTIVAVAAVGALFVFLVWPMIQTALANQSCKTYGAGWKAVRVTNKYVGNTGSDADNKKVAKFKCCNANNSECFEISE